MERLEGEEVLGEHEVSPKVLERVSPFDSDIIQRRVESASKSKSTIAFKDLIEWIRECESYINNADSNQSEAEEYSKEVKAAITQLRKQWEQILFDFISSAVSKRDGRERVERQITYPFLNNNLKSELRGVFGEDLADFAVNNLYHAIADGRISDDVVLQVSENHVAEIEIRKRALEIESAQQKDGFKKSVEVAIRKGELPQEVALMLSRIDRTKVRLDDRLLSVSSTVSGESHMDGDVSVTTDFFYDFDWKDRLRETLFHEFVHTIAGEEIVLKDKHSSRGDEIIEESLVLKKSGVVIGGKNRWLNEAITEYVTGILLDIYVEDIRKDDTGITRVVGHRSYSSEQDKLKELVKRGLSKDKIINAYFENILPRDSKSDKKQGSAFGDLMREIVKLEGEFAILKLDNTFVLRNLLGRFIDNNMFCCVLSVERRELMKSKFNDPGSDFEWAGVNVSLGRHSKDTVSTDVFIYHYFEGEANRQKAMAQVLSKQVVLYDLLQRDQAKLSSTEPNLKLNFQAFH